MSVRSDKKQRLSVYLEPDLKRRLSEFADRREQSASLIAEAALASFLSPDADERKEAAMVKRLDRLDRSLHRLERDLEITSEMLALFIRFWLTSTVALPENSQAAARSIGGERYERFIASLGRRLSQGRKLQQELSEEIEQKND